ncbi:hypothetical protein CVV68_09560 [Arthrobacter livingstonensis]|uniref:Uncharacterized protein n=1 Tax=Arthrobacter livingstonensis TaxID=670078 RepID=A0A2V5LK93_9MICC|nr:hypothetical protein CVV68_09560 [Arthrobacter livingstonensis]
MYLHPTTARVNCRPTHATICKNVCGSPSLHPAGPPLPGRQRRLLGAMDAKRRRKTR